MRAVRRNGEGVDLSRSLRLTDDQLLRVRALQMRAMRNQGQSNSQIARYFRLSERHVRRSINGIPESVRRRVDGQLA